jgi:hypothetical protein
LSAPAAESGVRAKREKVTSKIDADESMNVGAIKAMAKAEALAVSIMEGIAQAKGKKKRAPNEEEVTNVLLEMGDNWPTQVRPNVSDVAVTGMCLGMVNAFTAGLRVSLASQRCPMVNMNMFLTF